MFHTYVKNARGVSIDIDRASFLMDSDLRQEASEYLDRIRPRLPDQEVGTLAQAFFDHYAELHLQKYGKPFPPAVSSEPF